MGLPEPALVEQQLDSQQEDVCETGVGCGAVTSDGPQQLGPQQDAVLSCGVPSTCKAVRAYLALTSCRNCSSLWGTVLISLFLSIHHHEKSTMLLSISFAWRDGARQKRTHRLPLFL